MFGNKHRKAKKYIESVTAVKDLPFILWNGRLTTQLEDLFLKRASELIHNLDEVLRLAECANNENYHLRYRILDSFLNKFGYGTDEQFEKLLTLLLPQSNINVRIFAGVLAERATHDPEAFNEISNYSSGYLMECAKYLHPESKEKVFLQHAIENAILSRIRNNFARYDIMHFCQYSDCAPVTKANVLIAYLIEKLPLTEKERRELMYMLTEDVSPFPRSLHRCILITLLES